MNIEELSKYIEDQKDKRHPREYIYGWDDMCKWVDSMPLIKVSPERKEEMDNTMIELCSLWEVQTESRKIPHIDVDDIKRSKRIIDDFGYNFEMKKNRE